MFYIVDEKHQHHQNITEVVTSIVFNNEFKQLQSELEAIYKRKNFNKPKRQAFQDALYSFLAQQEDNMPAKAL